MHNLISVAAFSPEVKVGNPDFNTLKIIEEIKKSSADILVFPELCITGYSCRDLFRNSLLLEKAIDALESLKPFSKEKIIVVGCPIAVDNRLFNCAVVLGGGVILGIVPKQNIPNYAEFEESRWFRAADGSEPYYVRMRNSAEEKVFQDIPFGINLLFRLNSPNELVIIGVEICEDLWMPIPPSSFQSIAGANLLVNVSASNETVGKSQYRRELVANQSGRCVSAYVYSSCGPTESTTDVVFGGHCLIGYNGKIIDETKHVGHVTNQPILKPRKIECVIDIERLVNERRLLTSFGDSTKLLTRKYEIIDVDINKKPSDLKGKISFDNLPFVPKNPETLKERCAEIFGIQCAGLAGRLNQLKRDTNKDHHVYIGISGGLDSTLALLVTYRAFKELNIPVTNIHGVTMPGFGTTEKTKSNAVNLMTQLGISQETIDIQELCMQAFREMGHEPFGIDIKNVNVEQFRLLLQSIPKEKRNDIVFENVQARMRTFILMSKGFVIGTGDLSELALGWCTYNGDHMSMYGVNCSVPKTLVKFMVKYIAENLYATLWKHDAALTFNTLMSIYETTISPELLPVSAEGEIEQSSEDSVGPYELVDFYLANFLRTGFSPEKLLFMANNTEFSQKYSHELKIKTLKTFFKRFFSQQFKRSCIPDGPKVGSISLSPRGDWRMPSDADPSIWLESIEEIQ